jgi:transposase
MEKEIWLYWALRLLKNSLEDLKQVTMKSGLDIKPVYVSREDRINAHVLACFVSLVVIRLVQKKTDYNLRPNRS